MNQALIQAMSPEARAKLFEAFYHLLGLQVTSYHRHYGMGESTSVPEETAKELAESLWYTLEKAGGKLLEEGLSSALARGQELLEAETEAAKRQLILIAATAPEAANDSYHDTLRTLNRFLQSYDPRHFAHRVPKFLEYPLLLSDWQDFRGIDQVNAYLRCMWLENQILADFAPEALEELYRQIDPDFWGIPLNLCRQPLLNALGLALLGKPIHTLALSSSDRLCLKDVSKDQLNRAFSAVFAELDLRSPDAQAYAQSLAGEAFV